MTKSYENNIGAPKMWNLVQSKCSLFCNIGLFSFAHCKFITLYIVFFIFGIFSFLVCYLSLSLSLSLSRIIAFKSDRDNFFLLLAFAFKSYKYIESNTEKKINQCKKRCNKWSKEIKSENFCFLKVGRAIAMGSDRGRIGYIFDSVWKIILHFGCTNNISAKCN